MRIIALLLMLALLSPAQAGDADDPEVTDPAGDDTAGTGEDPTQAWDILYIFVQEEGTCGPEHLYFEMKMSNLVTMDAGAGPGHFKEVTFNLRGDEHVLQGTAGTQEFTLDGQETAGGIDNTLEIYYWCVAYDDVGGVSDGDTVDGIWGRTADPGNDHDRAPDSDTGRAFVVGASEGGDAAADLVLDAPADVEGNASFEVSIMNNASTSDTVFLQANETSGWNVTVVPANATIEAGANATFNVSLVAGTENATITFAVSSELGFRGSLQVNATLPPTDPMGDGMAGDGMDGDGMGGNGTNDPDEDSPLPVVLVLVALALAMRRR